MKKPTIFLPDKAVTLGHLSQHMDAVKKYVEQYVDVTRDKVTVTENDDGSYGIAVKSNGETISFTVMSDDDLELAIKTIGQLTVKIQEAQTTAETLSGDTVETKLILKQIQADLETAGQISASLPTETKKALAAYDKLVEFSDAEKTANRLEELNTTATGKITALEGVIDEADTAKSGLATTLGNVSDAEATLDGLTEQNSKAKTNLADLTAANGTAETNIENLSKTGSAAKSALDSSITTAQSLKADLDSASSTYLKKTDAASTYLTQQSAAATYATQEALAQAGKVQSISANGTALTIDNSKNVDIPLADASTDGLMSSSDYTKLSLIEDGAQANPITEYLTLGRYIYIREDGKIKTVLGPLALDEETAPSVVLAVDSRTDSTITLTAHVYKEGVELTVDEWVLAGAVKIYDIDAEAEVESYTQSCYDAVDAWRTANPTTLLTDDILETLLPTANFTAPLNDYKNHVTTITVPYVAGKKYYVYFEEGATVIDWLTYANEGVSTE